MIVVLFAIVAGVVLGVVAHEFRAGGFMAPPEEDR